MVQRSQVIQTDRNIGMGLAVGRLGNLKRALVQGQRTHAIPPLAQGQGHIVQIHRHNRVVLAQRLFVDRNHTLIDLGGLGVVPNLVQQGGQVVQTGAYVWMCRTIGSGINLGRPLKHGLCFGEFSCLI